MAGFAGKACTSLTHTMGTCSRKETSTFLAFFLFQVSGEGITLNIELLKSAFNGDLQRKMIPLKLPGVAGSLPECLKGIDLLHITEDDLDDEAQNIYDEIVGPIITRLKETKSSLISQKSIEEK